MKKKIFLIFIILLIELFGVGANKTSAHAVNTTYNINKNSYNIDVRIHYSITLDDKVKSVNPNIIKATRQAIFNYDSNNAKFSHYKYSRNHDIYIFKVNKIGSNTWIVRYWEKQHSIHKYNKNGYCYVTVEKQKSGSFKGSIINPGGPCIKGDETY